ncbi:MAG: hypothetical protein AB7P02_25850 [Alphaproteobacteria bacterium]
MNGPRRIVVLARGLDALIHDQYVCRRAIVDAARSGVPIEVLGGPAPLPPGIAGTPGARVIFRDVARPPGPPDRYAGEVDRHIALARQVTDEIVGADLGLSDDDLVWLPTAAMGVVEGLAVALRRLRKRPAVAVCLHYATPPDASLAPGTVPALLLRVALRSLDHSLSPRRPLIAATTRGLARRLTPLVGRAVETLASPHWYDPPPGEDAVAPALPGGDGPLVGVLGRPRADKGSAAIGRIAAAVRAASPGLRLIVQDFAPGGAHPPLFGRLHAAGAVEVVPWPISDGAFIGLVRRLDLVLLPYAARLFVDRLSGPFCFAAAWGVPAAATRGTWMSGEIEAGRAAGVTFAAVEPGEIARAVAAALADLPALKARAGRLAGPWRADDGTRMVEQLLRYAQAAQGAPQGMAATVS